MDLVSILQPFFVWLLDYFSIAITLGGFTFSIGALYMWFILACILIAFVKGMAE